MSRIYFGDAMIRLRNAGFEVSEEPHGVILAIKDDLPWHFNKVGSTYDREKIDAAIEYYHTGAMIARLEARRKQMKESGRIDELEDVLPLLKNLLRRIERLEKQLC